MDASGTAKHLELAISVGKKATKTASMNKIDKRCQKKKQNLPCLLNERASYLYGNSIYASLLPTDLGHGQQLSYEK